MPFDIFRVAVLLHLFIMLALIVSLSACSPILDRTPLTPDQVRGPLSTSRQTEEAWRVPPLQGASILSNYPYSLYRVGIVPGHNAPGFGGRGK